MHNLFILSIGLAIFSFFLRPFHVNRALAEYEMVLANILKVSKALLMVY